MMVFVLKTLIFEAYFKSQHGAYISGVAGLVLGDFIKFWVVGAFRGSFHAVE